MSRRRDVNEYAHACAEERGREERRGEGEEERRRGGGEEERRRGEVERTDKRERRGEVRACDVVCPEDEIPPRQNSIRGKGAIRISHIGARALIRIESNRG